MKKNIMQATLFAAIALFAGYNVQKSDAMSDIALANVEALAEGEVIIATPCMEAPYNYCIYLFPDDYFMTPGVFVEI